MKAFSLSTLAVAATITFSASAQQRRRPAAQDAVHLAREPDAAGQLQVFRRSRRQAHQRVK